MILMNKICTRQPSAISHWPFTLSAVLLLLLFAFPGCKVYSFKDAVIPTDVKTIKIGFIENRARYVNPQFSPKLTDKLQQKITGQTKLTRTNNDDAHYVISGQVTNYDASQTVGISGQQATTNRLTVTVHINLRKTLENKTEEFDVSRSFDYSANLQLQQAEGQLMDEVVRSLTDDIFNRIFSNW